MNQKKMKTNWNVITGGPCTGKTTVIDLLDKRGYKTTIEHARHYIDTMKAKGNTVEEIRENKRLFQLGILDMQVEQEAILNPDELVFLDRAIPDALAYYHYLKLEVDAKLQSALDNACYNKIFILDPLPLIKDYARIEDEKAQKEIHALIIKVYQERNCPVVFVPVLPPEERVNFIIKNL